MIWFVSFWTINANVQEDFKFKEGQYLYLNCPHVSANEWHPFTISSAPDDLKFGPRIHLVSGEEVAEVPRPRGLPSSVKWKWVLVYSKYHYIKYGIDHLLPVLLTLIELLSHWIHPS